MSKPFENWSAADEPIVGDRPVRLVDIDIPFGRMVAFMVKWTFASIPAALIVAVLVIVGGAVGGAFVRMLYAMVTGR